MAIEPISAEDTCRGQSEETGLREVKEPLQGHPERDSWTCDGDLSVTNCITLFMEPPCSSQKIPLSLGDLAEDKHLSC
jgi:hypothetical protein